MHEESFAGRGLLSLHSHVAGGVIPHLANFPVTGRKWQEAMLMQVTCNSFLGDIGIVP